MESRTLGHYLNWALVAAVLGFLLLPVVIMIPASFSAADQLEFPPTDFSSRWYKAVLTDPLWLGSTGVSVRIALVAASIATLIGVLLAIAQLRGGGIQGRMRSWLMLPQIAPHIVLAAGLFSLLLKTHNLGSVPILTLIHVTLALPLILVIIVAAADGIDPLLWPAASTLGASTKTIVRKVLLPLIAPSLVISFVLAFVISWDEVTFAVFVGPSVTPTLPSRMFSYLRELINPSVTAIATLLLVVSAIAGLAILILNRLNRTRSSS